MAARVRSTFVGERRFSLGDFSTGGFRVEASLLEPGDLARLADSRNHCFMDANWLMNGC